MSSAYFYFRRLAAEEGRTGALGPLERTQHQWLAARQQCGGDALCLRRAYDDRLQDFAYMKQAHHGPTADPPVAPQPEAPLTMEQDRDRVIQEGHLAGFTPEEITLTAEQNLLTVEGRKSQKGDHQYLYQGISARPFRHIFNLADFVQVDSASFENGLLKIKLVREVPEAMKPRRIAINTGYPQITSAKAA